MQLDEHDVAVDGDRVHAERPGVLALRVEAGPGAQVEDLLVHGGCHGRGPRAIADDAARHDRRAAEGVDLVGGVEASVVGAEQRDLPVADEGGRSPLDEEIVDAADSDPSGGGGLAGCGSRGPGRRGPGLGGRPFRLYKFRTMARPYDAGGRRIPDADRLSVSGRFLRRSRLDELPQLFNILIGEMSFIGPRPLLAADQYPQLDARLTVRPGMTGWAQIKGGRELSAADKAALDVWYIRNACFRVDLEILLGTLRVVLLGERAADRDAIRDAWHELRNGAADMEWDASPVPHSARVQPSA